MTGTSKRLSVYDRQFIFRPLTKLNNCWLIKIGKGDSAHSGHFCLRLGTAPSLAGRINHVYPWLHEYPDIDIHAYRNITYICTYMCVRILVILHAYALANVYFHYEVPCHKPRQTPWHMYKICTLVVKNYYYYYGMHLAAWPVGFLFLSSTQQLKQTIGQTI